MHDMSFLYELAVIFGVAVVVVVLLGRIGLPSIAGMLVAGVLLGPGAFGLIKNAEEVEVLAEVGVVLLLFTIGLELSLDRLRRIWKLVAIGGGVQVGLTILLTTGLALGWGYDLNVGVFFGFLVALSSTAIVLRALAERDEMSAPHGRMILGVLIFQDLSVVPMMLLVPLMGSTGGATSGIEVALTLGGAALMVVVVVGGAWLLVPHILRIVAAERKRDLFVLTVLLICIGTAWLTSLSGLSLALGAFLAGIVLAGSGYGHQAMSDVLPFRDAFTSLFFISVGMLLDVRILLDEPVLVFGIFFGILIGKFIITTIAGLVMRFPLRVAMITGIGLAQVGEFSFVLIKVGEQAGLITEAESRLFLSAGVLTMLVTPVLVRLAPNLAAGMSRLNPLARVIGTQQIVEAPVEKGLTDHVIIAGFGMGGRTLARSLKAQGIDYVVLELNPTTVDAYRKEGEPMFYGDVTSAEVLHQMSCGSAREVVLVINDAHAVRRCIAAVHQFSPEQWITVRTRYFEDVAELKRIGASDVVVEEFENAVELMARVLRRAGVPRNLIAERIGEARHSRDELVRPLALPRQRLGQHAELMQAVKVDTYQLRPGDWAEARTLKDMRLREFTGATIVAIHVDGKVVTNIGPAQVLNEGNILYLLGEQGTVTGAMEYMRSGELPKEE